MGSCAAPSAKGDDKFITTDYLQQCLFSEFQAQPYFLVRICVFCAVLKFLHQIDFGVMLPTY
ncbi:hypothetical protein EA183_26010 [Escherichia coli]|nr:hypothetical protein EA183_26010 [Escherichia coli]